MRVVYSARFFLLKNMSYIVKKFNKPIVDVRQAVERALSENYKEAKIINNKVSLEFFLDTHYGSKKCELEIMLFRISNEETAIFIEFFGSSSAINHDEQLRKAITAVESELCEYAQFSNYTKEDFERRSLESNDTPIDVKEESFPSLIDKDEFMEIIKKLVTTKSLLDAEILNLEEYKEIVDPLIERL